MSKENAERFLDLALGDAALQEALETAGSEPVLDRAVRLGAERGLQFGTAELEASLRARQAMGEPLSDEQLDQVAGGFRFLTEILSNVSKTRSEISMTFARNARA